MTSPRKAGKQDFEHYGQFYPVSHLNVWDVDQIFSRKINRPVQFNDQQGKSLRAAAMFNEIKFQEGSWKKSGLIKSSGVRHSAFLIFKISFFRIS